MSFQPFFNKFLNIIEVPGPSGSPPLFILDIPSVEGVFERGALSTVSFFISMFFSLVIIVWIVYTLFAVFKIISSQGNPEEVEKSFASIRNIWIGISMGLVFFAVIALLGAIFGFGSVYDWSTRLAQCGGYQGNFYFRQVPDELEVLKKEGITYGSGKVYCCRETINRPFPAGIYDKYDLKDEDFNWLVSPDGASPPGPQFVDCKVEFERILE